MDREALRRLLLGSYGAVADCPWVRYPDYEVFRHPGNQKWFAVLMGVPKSKLGLEGPEVLDVVNLKCDPLLIGSLREETGFFPAYHMNKEHWITAALDGSVPEEKLRPLLDMSYEATAPKARRRR